MNVSRSASPRISTEGIGFLSPLNDFNLGMSVRSRRWLIWLLDIYRSTRIGQLLKVNSRMLFLKASTCSSAGLLLMSSRVSSFMPTLKIASFFRPEGPGS